MADPVDRGNVTNGDPQYSYPQGRVTDGVTTLLGSPNADNVQGTARDDIIVAGAATNRLTKKPGTDYINGKDGHDTVILNGKREDYVASMPDVDGYPSPGSKEWEGKKSLYGSGIILEHAETGDKYNLRNIERVGFDADGKNAELNPRDAAAYLKQQQEKGAITYSSTQELRAGAESGMDSAERKNARLASTPEASKVMEQNWAAEGDKLTEVKKQALAASEAAHPDIMNYKPIEPGPSTSEGKVDTMLGIQSQAPARAPGMSP